jgi:hypothetical protein
LGIAYTLHTKQRLVVPIDADQDTQIGDGEHIEVEVGLGCGGKYDSATRRRVHTALQHNRQEYPIREFLGDRDVR